jgi:hypothetical protein
MTQLSRLRRDVEMPGDQRHGKQAAIGAGLFGGRILSGCNGTSLDISRHHMPPEPNLVHKVNF